MVMSNVLAQSVPEHLFFEIQTSREWLATAAAATYLKISPNALRIMVHRGQVKAHKLRNRLRFKLQDLKALIQSRS
jgi:excisionase family DNA binding protein